jgi:hypothetical protein
MNDWKDFLMAKTEAGGRNNYTEEFNEVSFPSVLLSSG